VSKVRTDPNGHPNSVKVFFGQSDSFSEFEWIREKLLLELVAACDLRRELFETLIDVTFVHKRLGNKSSFSFAENSLFSTRIPLLMKVRACCGSLTRAPGNRIASVCIRASTGAAIWMLQWGIGPSTRLR